MNQKNQQPTPLAVENRADARAEMDVKQRYAHLLETGDGADVYFLVGKPGEEKELIAAHRFVLSTTSSVFERQFSFGNAIHTQEGTKEKPIEVPDIRPNSFRAMLKFVYSDDFSSVSKQNIMDVFYAAKKYMLHRLIKHCRQSLFSGQNLDPGNALSVLKHSQQHEEKELIDHCWSFMDKNAPAVLGSGEFLALNQHDLCELFSRDNLKIDELLLFQSLHRWTSHKCVTTELENTAENLRDIVGLAIYQVRFPLLTLQQFNQTIVPTGLLNEKDIIALFIHFTADQSADANNTKLQYPNRFNGQQRCASKVKKCQNQPKRQQQPLRCEYHQRQPNTFSALACPTCQKIAQQREQERRERERQEQERREQEQRGRERRAFAGRTIGVWRPAPAIVVQYSEDDDDEE